MDDESKQILEEYKIWKRATPFLYDVITSHSLEWPVSRLQWLPSKHLDPVNGVRIHQVVFGTATSSSSSFNSILLADVRLPCVPVDGSDPVFHSTTKPSSASSSSSSTKPSSSSILDSTTSAPAITCDGALGKMVITQRLEAPSAVRALAACPQAPRYLAARFVNEGETWIYDTTIPAPAESNPSSSTLSSSTSSSSTPPGTMPILRLKSHDTGGGACAWSPLRPFTLATSSSSSSDGRILLWDLASSTSCVATTSSSPSSANISKKFGKAPSKTSASVSSSQSQPSSPSVSMLSSPQFALKNSNTAHNCLEWHHFDSNLLASGGEDRFVRLWDARQLDHGSALTTSSSSKSSSSSASSSSKWCTNTLDGHKGAILSLSFNQKSEHLLLAASADKTVSMWDRRNLSIKLHSFEYHSSPVVSVRWAPFSESVFCSAGADRRVMVWDLRRIGDEQEVDEVEDGPPELLFVHGGHVSPVTDACWSTTEAPWLMASASDNGVVQMWQMQAQLWRDAQPEPICIADLE